MATWTTPGGVFEFGRCYIHPADIPMLDGRTLPARVGYVRGQLPPGEAPEASAFVPDGPVEFVPLKAGDKLDLGGRALEVLHVPGHTRGSLCYLDTASGDFFAGDACNNNTLLMMDVSATIEEYLEALLALKERQGDIRRFYLFHGPSSRTRAASTTTSSAAGTFWRAPTTASPWTFWAVPVIWPRSEPPAPSAARTAGLGTSSTTPSRCARAEVSAMKRLY